MICEKYSQKKIKSYDIKQLLNIASKSDFEIKI